MRGQATDEWYSPPAIIQDLIDQFGAVTDYCVSEDSIEYTRAVLDDPDLYHPVLKLDVLALGTTLPIGETQFLNPPYSKDSEGAEAFLKALMRRFCIHNFALINISPWMGRVVKELDLKIGVVHGRVRFHAGPRLQAERLAQGKTANPKSPQYNNAFLYRGPLPAKDLPPELGGYLITWLEQ
jgi:hypothetical protein